MIDFSNDSILLEEMLNNNEDALEYLYHRYFRRLRGYAYRFTEDEESAQDIVQECYIKLWKKRSELKAISIRSLLFTMVRNECVNFLKKQKNIEKLLSEYTSQLNSESLYYEDFYIHDNSIYSELEQQIESVISNLPKRCKEVFLLSRYDGLKNREIAQRLEISTTAVEKHISKALQQLEVHLAKHYYTDH